MSLENQCVFYSEGQCTIAGTCADVAKEAEEADIRGLRYVYQANFDPQFVALMNRKKDGMWGMPLQARVALRRDENGQMVLTYPCSSENGSCDLSLLLEGDAQLYIESRPEIPVAV